MTALDPARTMTPQAYMQQLSRWRVLEIAFWLATLLPFWLFPTYLSLASQIAITALFGPAGAESDLARAAKLPYRWATRDLKCIDDPASAHYSRIVDRSAVALPDWASCEDMLRDDGRYAVGAVVAHNVDPPLPGAGSCIFLHVREGPGAPTAGCTAMALADMSEIAGWLDGKQSPLLVQLPQAEYERCRTAWGLPAFGP